MHAYCIIKLNMYIKWIKIYYFLVFFIAYIWGSVVPMSIVCFATAKGIQQQIYSFNLMACERNTIKLKKSKNNAER